MTVSENNATDDTGSPPVVIEPLTADRFADYGEVLGLPMKQTQEPDAYSFRHKSKALRA